MLRRNCKILLDLELLRIQASSTPQLYEAPWRDGYVYRDAKGQFTSVDKSIVEAVDFPKLDIKKLELSIDDQKDFLIKSELTKEEFAELLGKNNPDSFSNVSYKLAKDIPLEDMKSTIGDLTTELFPKSLEDDGQPVIDVEAKDHKSFLSGIYNGFIENSTKLLSSDEFGEFKANLVKYTKSAIAVSGAIAMFIAPEVAIPLIAGQSIAWGAVLSSAAISASIVYGLELGLDAFGVDNPWIKATVGTIAGFLLTHQITKVRLRGVGVENSSALVRSTPSSIVPSPKGALSEVKNGALVQVKDKSGKLVSIPPTNTSIVPSPKGSLAPTTPSPSSIVPSPSGKLSPSPSGSLTTVPNTSGLIVPSPSGKLSPSPSGSLTTVPNTSGSIVPSPSGKLSPSPSGSLTTVPNTSGSIVPVGKVLTKQDVEKVVKPLEKEMAKQIKTGTKEVKAQRLKIAELKAPLFNYWNVSNTKELKRVLTNLEIIHPIDKVNFSKKEVWENLYRKNIGILPHEVNATGYGTINGIDVLKYYRPWQVFGLNPKTATMAEIKVAYRKLSKIYHPDNLETGDRVIQERLDLMYKGFVMSFGGVTGKGRVRS